MDSQTVHLKHLEVCPRTEDRCGRTQRDGFNKYLFTDYQAVHIKHRNV